MELLVDVSFALPFHVLIPYYYVVDFVFLCLSFSGIFIRIPYSLVCSGKKKITTSPVSI